MQHYKAYYITSDYRLIPVGTFEGNNSTEVLDHIMSRPNTYPMVRSRIVLMKPEKVYCYQEEA
jgi:hypothetical protein